MNGVATPPIGAIDVMRLPCMPLVLSSAIRHANDGSALGALVTTVASDPVLAARVVAATGLRGAQDSSLSLVRHMRRLGSGLIQSILSRAASDRLRSTTPLPTAPNAVALWAHSLHCAQIAKALAQASGYTHPEEAYLAGLFHDIGMLALAADLPHTYAATFARASLEAELVTVELDQLDTTHAEVGAALMTRLDVPSHLCDAILLQHAPYDDLVGTHKLVRLLWVAETCAGGGAPQVDLERLGRLIGLTEGALARALALGNTAFQRRTLELNPPALPDSAMWPTPALLHRAASPPTSSEPTPSAWQSALDSDLLGAVTQSASLHQVPQLLSDAEDAAQILSRICSITSALSGLDRYLAFMHDPARAMLIGWRIESDRLSPTQLEVPLWAVSSLLVKAAVERRMLEIRPSRGKLTLRGVDLQIGRMLEAEALVLIPMLAGSAMLGVLVFGLDHDRAARMATDADLLARLTAVAGRVLADRKISTARRQAKEGEMSDRLREAARRLVHEARNPLTVMKTQLELLGERARSGQAIDRDVQVLREEIDRVTEIVGKIGTAELGIDTSPAPIDINALVREMMGIYKEALFTTRAVEVELALDRRIPQALADRSALKQVLLNLWMNASEAMPSGGCLSVRTIDRVNWEGKLMVELSVSDTGRGMPAEIMDNLFSRRLATMGSSDRGFGLSNTLTLIKQLNGHLLCRSEPELGTTFTLLLPRVTEAREKAN